MTYPDAPTHSKASLFIVDTDNPRFNVVKRTSVRGSGGAGGHCEVVLEDCGVAEAIDRLIDRSVQILGALGVTQYSPVEPFFRDVRAFRIYDGPSEAHRMVVARRVLRRAAGGRQATGLTGFAGGLVGE